MPARSTFKLDGHRFAFKSCSIMAYLGDPYWCDKYNNGAGKELSWGMEFCADSINLNDEFVAPQIDIDALPVDLKNWHQLSGVSVKGVKPINPRTEERYGMVYMYGHNQITKCTIHIRSRRLSRFRVSVSGRDEEGHTFEVDASVPFWGVRVGASEHDSAKTVTARLSDVLDVSNLTASRFKLRGHRYDSGVEMASMVFKPSR